MWLKNELKRKKYFTAVPVIQNAISLYGTNQQAKNVQNATRLWLFSKMELNAAIKNANIKNLIEKMDISLQNLLNKCKKANPDCNTSLIEKAYEFAKEFHSGQKRASGEEYFTHCAAAAEIVADLKADSQTIAATLLHDVLDDAVEEQKESLEKKIEKDFGKEILNLVQGVTKIGKIKFQGLNRAVENLRKMFLAIAQDIRVILIKLGDRLHNMQTLEFLPPEKQLRIARETMEIFVPLADRLGIGKIKGQLEDLSFKFLMPGEYKWLVEQVKDQFEQREKYLAKITPTLKKEILKENIKPIEIHSRAKHYYSLYRKLQRYEMNLNRIYDLVALRVIVPSIEDCYAALGVIHKLWRPLPGRIKDYIALPKPNGYQSIHTTVFCQGGKITEIQIRTPQMHEEARRGIAAHWYYSEQKGLKAYIKRIFTPAPEKELKWIKQLQEWQKEIKGPPEEFFQSLKIDFFKDRIFVFTPLGDVIDLPENATPIDFAYQIHTDIGHRCQGAKVDGKIVSLDTPLRNGQVVEIITQKQKKPSRDWLGFVKTSQSQTRIRQWLNKNKEQTLLGEEIKEREIKKEPPKHQQKQDHQIFIKPEVEIAGDEKIATNLGKCCKPQPPDEIAGYVTLNQKITVHRKDCKNFTQKKSADRVVKAEWKKGK